MGVVNSTTGHSPKGERKVAGIIYIAISVAVVLAFLVALLMSRSRQLDPYKAETPAQTAPDAGPSEANPGQGQTQ